MTPCELAKEVLAESNARCKDEDEAGSKLRDVAAMLEGDHSYLHMDKLVHLSAGVHETFDAKQVLATGCTPDEVFSNLCKQSANARCPDIQRFGNSLMLSRPLWVAYQGFSDVDWTDCTSDLPFSPPFIAALKYGAKALLAARNNKQNAALFASSTFQQLLTVALRADKDSRQAQQVARIPMKTKAYRR